MTSTNTKTPSETIDVIQASQFSTDSMVTLLVGKNEQTMIAQGDYLTRDSEFFAATMKKEWQEGQKRTIKLPEECPATMAHYLSFMHNGKLFAEEIATMDGNQILPCYEMLASLYVCGERFLNRPLQSAIIKQILRLFTIADKNQTFWAPTDYSVNITATKSNTLSNQELRQPETAMDDTIATTGELHVADVFDFNQEDLVTLLVGPEQKKMVVHGTYLARDPEFFQAALKKEWIEGQIRIISLPEQSPEVMAHYMNYTYSKILFSKGMPCREKSDFDQLFPSLTTLYVYGERFINLTIQRTVMEELFRLVEVKDTCGDTWGPSKDEVNIIYRGTPEKSPARRFMIDLNLSGGEKSWICEELEPAFLVDLAKALFDRCLGSGKCYDKITLKLEDYI
jgi:hypothetical protein